MAISNWQECFDWNDWKTTSEIRRCTIVYMKNIKYFVICSILHWKMLCNVCLERLKNEKIWSWVCIQKFTFRNRLHKTLYTTRCVIRYVFVTRCVCQTRLRLVWQLTSSDKKVPHYATCCINNYFSLPTKFTKNSNMSVRNSVFGIRDFSSDFCFFFWSEKIPDVAF